MVGGEDDQVRYPVEGYHGNPSALVLPGEPVVHPEQAGPTRLWIILLRSCRLAVGVDVVGDAVEGLILLGWIVDPEDDDVEVPAARGVGDRHAATLVLPREPAGHVDPVRPTVGGVAVL